MNVFTARYGLHIYVQFNIIFVSKRLVEVELIG